MTEFEVEIIKADDKHDVKNVDDYDSQVSCGDDDDDDDDFAGGDLMLYSLIKVFIFNQNFPGKIF